MTTADVLLVLDTLESAGVGVWVDGGWGVDALLERQTRAHDDLDLAASRKDLPRCQVALASLGYAHATYEEPGLPARLVLRGPAGREVDFHPLVFDSEGNGLQELGDGEWGTYPAAGLRGRGRIGGREVRCITPELQLAFHSAYEPAEKDRLDVALLAQRFGLEHLVLGAGPGSQRRSPRIE
jgi:lincosamide nucleotidyltransferase A/C/D/E